MKIVSQSFLCCQLISQKKSLQKRFLTHFTTNFFFFCHEIICELFALKHVWICSRSLALSLSACIFGSEVKRAPTKDRITNAETYGWRDWGRGNPVSQLITVEVRGCGKCFWKGRSGDPLPFIVWVLGDYWGENEQEAEKRREWGLSFPSCRFLLCCPAQHTIIWLAAELRRKEGRQEGTNALGRALKETVIENLIKMLNKFSICWQTESLSLSSI